MHFRQIWHCEGFISFRQLFQLWFERVQRIIIVPSFLSMAAVEHVIQISVTDKEVLKHIVLEYQYLTITEKMDVRDTRGVLHKLQNWQMARRGKVAALSNELGTPESLSELCQHLRYSAIVLYFRRALEEF